MSSLANTFKPTIRVMPDKVDMPDEQLSSESDEDWKAKYEEVCEMLAETEAELKEFQISSKELEDEMALDVERAEKAREDMENKLSRMEGERDDWKGKFMSLQSTHTTTVNSLQRELEALRETHRLVKIQLRDLEMGNDDLERHEREVVSSLEDMEIKYAKALEEKILLEHELQDRASMEEDMQRLRDELRDAATEASVLRDQLAKSPTEPGPELDDAFAVASPALSASESLLDVTLPSKSDLQPADLANDVDSPTLDTIRIAEQKPTPAVAAPSSRKAMRSPPPLRSTRAGALTRSTLASPSTSSPSRLPAPSPRRPLVSSNTIPVMPSTLASSSTTAPVPVSRRLPSAASTNSLVTRSKGMQMVSDMRSRVKVLEQRIQNRVPRMRKAGEVATKAAPPVPSPSLASTSQGGSASTAAAAMALKMQQRDREREKEKRASTTTTTSRSSTSAGDGESPGWVLVTTGSEEREHEHEKNRDQPTLRASAPSSSRPASFVAIAAEGSGYGSDYVTSPTTSTASSTRYTSSSTTVTAPPSSYRRSSELTASTSHQETSSGHPKGGGGFLGVSSAPSGLRPPSALGLRKSIGSSNSRPGSGVGIDLNASTASTIRPLTPTMLPSMSSSTISSSSTETSSASGLRRSTSVKSRVPSSSSSDGPARRSSLGASATLGQPSGATARTRTGLGQSTNSNNRPTNNNATTTTTNIPSGSVRSGRPPSTTMPSRPAIPSMIPPTATSNGDSMTVKAAGLGLSTASRMYGIRGPSPIPPSPSLPSAIPPPRPGSNLGMVSKNTFMGSSASGGLGRGKSMIGRPTSFPVPSSGAGGGGGGGVRGVVPRKLSAARAGGGLDDDEVY